MSRLREFGKVYPWGSERPTVAKARAQMRKAKLLKDLEASEEIARQRIEKAKQATSEKIKEAELVIEMVTQYQAERALKPARDGSRVYSNVTSPSTGSRHSGILTFTTQKNPDILRPSGDRHVSLHKTEAIITQDDLLPPRNTLAHEPQANCASKQHAISNNDVQASPLSQAGRSTGVFQPTSHRSSEKNAEAFTCHANQIHNVTAEGEPPDFDPPVPVKCRKSSPQQDELHCLSPGIRIENPAVAKMIDEGTAPQEFQRLENRKRVLEEALDDLYARYDGEQSSWTTEVESQKEQLEQELYSIDRMLGEARAQKPRPTNSPMLTD
ncbi:hypothetical protein [Microvirga guangxiensis]|nr:hypothetical protein [Microvirga guangxiensis]